MTPPLVSICIPTRNRAASLRESLKTICGQNYPRIEIVISDNDSDDDTPQVCRELMQRDERIQYVRHPRNLGLHGNHNFCLGAGTGELLCIWHDHDVHDGAIVSEYVAFLERHPRVGVVCSDWNLIDDDGREIGVRDHRVAAVTPGREYISQTIRAGRTSIGIPGAMVRRVALGEARFEPAAPIGYGDFPLWFRVAETWDVGHIDQRLWSWRQNSQSHSARAIESIAHDYHTNMEWYFGEYLTRWPDRGADVDRWRASTRRYLFWALAYEVALHFRNQARAGAAGSGSRSLFEIMNYRLTPEQFASAMSQMKRYRSRASEHVAYAALRAAIALHLTAPVAWLSRHQATLRGVLGLE